MTAYKLGILWLWYIGGGWVGQNVEKIRVGVALALGWPVLSVACSRTISRDYWIDTRKSTSKYQSFVLAPWPLGDDFEMVTMYREVSAVDFSLPGGWR